MNPARQIGVRRAFGLVGMVLGLVALSLCLGGCRERPKHTLRFYIQSTGSPGVTSVRTMVMPMSGAQIAVEMMPIIFEGDVIGVDKARVELGEGLLFQLGSKASRELYRQSVANRGRYIVVENNGIPLGFRQLDLPINDGRLFMFVELPASELDQFVQEIQESVKVIQRQL